ncbi:MAG: hypothetical protein D6730_00695, partial [Bacteroidetes bacterium]
SFALKSTLAYHADTKKLGGVDPATYDPMQGAIYYPHKYVAKFGNPMRRMMMSMMKAPPIPAKFKVVDDRSDLFDVASLLWGESEFYYFTDPSIHDNYDALFGDPKWMAKDMPEAEIEKALATPGKTLFPKDDPHKLAMGITVVNFKNMMGLHFNKAKGTLVDSWSPAGGQGNHIAVENAGMAVVALANTYHRLHDVDKVRNGAKMLLTAQANFLLSQQEADGSIANGFTLGSSITKDASTKTLLSQAFAIRAWLAAYQVTKEQKYLTAATKTYEFMQDKLWSEQAGVYRTALGANQSEYNGLVYGATLGAMREMAIAKQGQERQLITQHIDEYFVNVANKAGLQIAEINMTGEMIPPPTKVAEMMSQMNELMKTNPDKAQKMRMRMMDSDQDGVPKPKFVMGTKYGAAPVLAGKVVIATR